MIKPEPIELENNLGPDAVTGEINRVPWMAYDVDEMDLYIDEKDAEIAELKDKIQMHDFFWEGCGFAKRGFKNTIAVSEAFDRLEAENAELKQKLMPCLNGDCILTCEVVEKYGKENAELKDKCQMHDFFWEGCGFAKRGFKNTIAVSEAFDRLEAENAELKQKLEDAKASAYAEMVDAGMRERRLRRALWLARVQKAIDKQKYYSECRYDGWVHRENVWLEVERKCRNKAEEYK